MLGACAVTCTHDHSRSVRSPLDVHSLLQSSALRQIRATITVSVSQGCPVAFDVDAYALRVAADTGVTVDRVVVTVVCRDGQPLVPRDERRRSLQSDGAELIITATITELTAVQAAAVCGCSRVPRCTRSVASCRYGSSPLSMPLTILPALYSTLESLLLL